MNDLRELYQEVILDHSKHPRNFHEVNNATAKADGFNPLCGDKITLFLLIHEEIIVEVGFQGSGCAISMASASLMTEEIKGKTLKEAEEIFAMFHDMLTIQDKPNIPGKLVILAGVKQYPMRVKCATLAWHTLEAAIYCKPDSVTTE